MWIKNKNMENKSELLKKLGFSENYLKVLFEKSNIEGISNESECLNSFETISRNSSDVNFIIIEQSEKPFLPEF